MDTCVFSKPSPNEPRNTLLAIRLLFRYRIIDKSGKDMQPFFAIPVLGAASRDRPFDAVLPIS